MRKNKKINTRKKINTEKRMNVKKRLNRKKLINTKKLLKAKKRINTRKRKSGGNNALNKILEMKKQEIKLKEEIFQKETALKRAYEDIKINQHPGFSENIVNTYPDEINNLKNELKELKKNIETREFDYFHDNIPPPKLSYGLEMTNM